MIINNDIEIYSAHYLGDRIYGEGLIEGFGFVLYGQTLSLIPIFTNKDPEKEKEQIMQKLKDLIYNLADIAA